TLSGTKKMSLRCLPIVVLISMVYWLSRLSQKSDMLPNPIEDVWLQAKRCIRRYYHLLKNFDHVKRLFEFVTHLQVFCFEKIFKYGFFPQLI
ncbi:MAG: hypothetical protein ACK556_02680, partial [Pseudanabaena sp.]